MINFARTPAGPGFVRSRRVRGRIHILELIIAGALAAAAITLAAGPRIWTATFRAAMAGRPTR